MGMRVLGRNSLRLGRCRQTRAGQGRAVSAWQRLQLRRRDIVGHIQRIDPMRHALRHIDFRAVRVSRKRVISRVGVHALMNMQKARVIKLHRARMRVDERRHRLQGDEQPEHQKSLQSVRHG